MAHAGTTSLPRVLWVMLVLGTAFYVNQYVPEPYMVGTQDSQAG